MNRDTHRVPREEYRECIIRLLEEYNRPRLINEGVECQLIIDTKHDHYQLVNVGWSRNRRRVYFCSIHIDIKDGKVWLQNNQTDILVAEDLVEYGIPKEDIVLGFHPPYVREHTGFAVS